MAKALMKKTIFLTFFVNYSLMVILNFDNGDSISNDYITYKGKTTNGYHLYSSYGKNFYCDENRNVIYSENIPDNSEGNGTSNFTYIGKIGDQYLYFYNGYYFYCDNDGRVMSVYDLKNTESHATSPDNNDNGNGNGINNEINSYHNDYINFEENNSGNHKNLETNEFGTEASNQSEGSKRHSVDMTASRKQFEDTLNMFKESKIRAREEKAKTPTNANQNNDIQGQFEATPKKLKSSFRRKNKKCFASSCTIL
jgi:hypothetical protein